MTPDSETDYIWKCGGDEEENQNEEEDGTDTSGLDLSFSKECSLDPDCWRETTPSGAG